MGKPKAIQSDEHKRMIVELFPHMDTSILAGRLGYTTRQIIDYAHKQGIKKTPEYRSNLSSRLAKNAKAGAFKKGCHVYNTRPIGATRKNFRGETVIKIAQPSQWIFLKQKIWEDANGPIPENHVIGYKDGNKDNCVLENLELVDKRDLMLKHSIHNLPPEIKELVQLRGNILRCITVRRKKENGSK